MKNIKTALVLIGTTVSLLAASLLVSVSTTGCGTFISGGGGTNNSAQINATALILQNAAYSGALAAITPPTGNSNNAPYFSLASQAIGAFVTGQNFSPAALQQALISIKAPQATNLWVQLGIGTVIDLYQVYFSQYVQGQTGSNTTAVVFVTAIQAGFNQALGVPVPPAPTPAHGPIAPPLPLMLNRPSVLPRPLK